MSMPKDDDEASNVTPLRPPRLQLIASNETPLPLTDKRLTVRARRELMEALNGQYAVVRHAGHVMVMTFEKLEHKVGRAVYSRAVPTFYSFADFKNLLMNQTVRIGTSREGYEDVPLGKFWLQQEDRRQFDGLVYRPGDARSVIDNKFNLWRGWGLEPKPGDWSLMREHILMVLAAGDKKSLPISSLGWRGACRTRTRGQKSRSCFAAARVPARVRWAVP